MSHFYDCLHALLPSVLSREHQKEKGIGSNCQKVGVKVGHPRQLVSSNSPKTGESKKCPLAFFDML